MWISRLKVRNRRGWEKEEKSDTEVLVLIDLERAVPRVICSCICLHSTWRTSVSYWLKQPLLTQHTLQDRGFLPSLHSHAHTEIHSYSVAYMHRHIQRDLLPCLTHIKTHRDFSSGCKYACILMDNNVIQQQQ